MHLRLSGQRLAFAAMVIASAIASAPIRIVSQDQPRPTFRTEANYVRVDAYTTTTDGVPIEDLRRDEFELLEDRVPQTIDQFATVRIRGGGPPTARSDPRTPEESRQAATDARARVFILFLDVMHVDRTASVRIAKPLTDALRNLLGPDDLVAVVMPGISVRALTFTRQIATIENALNNSWGARDDVALDPVERRYADCHPGIPDRPKQDAPDRGIAQEMILRRREAQTLDSLDSLVSYLRDAREERKAVITITNGWRMYRPNDNLSRSIRGTVPTVPQVTIDPQTGRLTAEPTTETPRASTCDTDRLRLASLDHDARFRQILDQANRANVSFYPIDPRGIVAFDDDIVPVAGVGQNPVLTPEEERARLAERSTSLHVMAEQTDGVAVTATSDFALGLRRMTTDLSAYYLLGYYSTGKLDGRFHAITVRATRPGVQIRARRGYLAASSAAPPAPLESSGAAAGAAEGQAISSALASLEFSRGIHRSACTRRWVLRRPTHARSPRSSRSGALSMRTGARAPRPMPRSSTHPVLRWHRATYPYCLRRSACGGPLDHARCHPAITNCACARRLPRPARRPPTRFASPCPPPQTALAFSSSNADRAPATARSPPPICASADRTRCGSPFQPRTHRSPRHVCSIEPARCCRFQFRRRRETRRMARNRKTQRCRSLACDRRLSD